MDDPGALWREFERDRSGNDARNRLVEYYLPVVRYHARMVARRLNGRVSADELLSSGVFGLMEAIRRFDHGRGLKFETFSARRIRGAMLDDVRALDWVPRSVREDAKRLRDAVHDLQVSLGRPPTDDELADRLAMTSAELEQLRCELPKRFVEFSSERRGGTERDSDPASDSASVDPVRHTQRTDVMALVTRGLSDRERLIITLYYYEELTMKEIGAVIGITRARVTQIHSDLIQRLRQQLVGRQQEFES